MMLWGRKFSLDIVFVSLFIDPVQAVFTTTGTTVTGIILLKI